MGIVPIGKSEQVPLAPEAPMEQYPLHASFARSRFRNFNHSTANPKVSRFFSTEAPKKKDYEDFYRKSRFRGSKLGGNRETFFRHLQNAPFYPLVIEWLFSPFSSNLRQISFQEFKNKLLKPGLVDRIVVSNESVAKVYVRRSPQNQSRYDTIEGSYFEIPIREGVKSCQTRYKYYFDIGSGYSFEKMLGKAEEAMGIDPHDYVPVTYVSEIDWHKAIMWSCVSEKFQGWPSKGDEVSGGGTPMRPDEPLDVFLFAIFNENQKPAPDKEVVLKKATEYGAVEIWMNERVRRACANSCADFMYGFRESSAKKGVEYWLIWKFEGEQHLLI
ncbi:hypothetical protein CASFOL_029754 [Castilleja foliolosa]|uniref:Uncharacterized protein n=1 Tax=Castilleja foliolosa TaxID=1961234 RepID=A0ABD3C8Q9_9LAMI